MSGRNPVRCWGCGAYGHRKADCPNPRGGAGSANDSVYGGTQREDDDLFAGLADFCGGFASQQQPQQHPGQPGGQTAPANLLGIPVATGAVNSEGVTVLRHATKRTAGEGLEAFKENSGVQDPACIYTSGEVARRTAAFLAARAASNKRLREPKSSGLDISKIPILRTGSPVQPQGQAGRGVLPGARNQPNRAVTGLAGDHRVGRAYRSRRQGQQHRHRHENEQQLTLDEEDDDGDEDIMDGPRASSFQGQKNMGAARVQGSMAQEQAHIGTHAPSTGRLGLAERPRSPSVSQAAHRHDLDTSLVRGVNIGADQMQNLVTDFVRAQPPGTSYTVEIRSNRAAHGASPPVVMDHLGRRLVPMDEDREDGIVPSQAARDQLLRTMIRGDPFEVNMSLGQRDRRPRPKED